MPKNIFSDYPRIAAALLTEPWLIEPGVHRSLVAQLHAHQRGAVHITSAASGPAFDPAIGTADAPDGYINQYATFDHATGIGMLDIKGVIGKGLSSMAMDCGGLCLDVVEEGLDGLAAMNPRAIQLYLNTPGGTVGGVEEFANSLRQFATTVAPVHAYVDSMCCSAGEWIATGATTRHAAGSATLGSIGVYTALTDSTEFHTKEGEKVHLIKTGPLKGAGYPGTEITAAQLADAQSRVDAIGADFFAAMSARWANLTPSVHFSGGTFAAKSPAGMALHDGLIPNRRAHLAALLAAYPR